MPDAMTGRRRAVAAVLAIAAFAGTESEAAFTGCRALSMPYFRTYHPGRIAKYALNSSNDTLCIWLLARRPSAQLCFM